MVNEAVFSPARFNATIETLILLVGCVGVTANAFAIVVLAGCRTLRQRIWSILLINQSIVDLIASIFTATYHGTLALGKLERRVPYQGLMGDLYCKLWKNAVWEWTLMSASSYNLLAITVERYLMVVHPIYHKYNVSRGRLYVMAICSWIIGALSQILYAVPTTELKGEYCAVYAVWPGVEIQRFAAAMNTIVPFFFPAVVMVILYGKIVLVLRAKARVGMTSQSVANKGITKSQTSLTKTCIVIVVTFIACWAPNQCFWMLYILGLDISLRHNGTYATLLIAYLNSIVNPFIYTFSFGEFQAAIRGLFGWKCITKKADDHSSSTSTGTATDSGKGGTATH